MSFKYKKIIERWGKNFNTIGLENDAMRQLIVFRLFSTRTINRVLKFESLISKEAVYVNSR